LLRQKALNKFKIEKKLLIRLNWKNKQREVKDAKNTSNNGREVL
jgi:hypothetical protein